MYDIRIVQANRKNILVSSGFTLVELLIAIVVISILTIVSLVAYNGVRYSAMDARMEANAQTAIKGIQLKNAADSSLTPLNELNTKESVRSEYNQTGLGDNIIVCYINDRSLERNLSDDGCVDYYEEFILVQDKVILAIQNRRDNSVNPGYLCVTRWNYKANGFKVTCFENDGSREELSYDPIITY